MTCELKRRNVEVCYLGRIESFSPILRAGGAGLALMIGMYNDTIQYDCEYSVHVGQYTGLETLTCFASAEGLAAD